MATKEDAQESLFAAIAKAAKKDHSDFGPQVESMVLERLALAYRYAAGGPQPGGAAQAK